RAAEWLAGKRLEEVEQANSQTTQALAQTSLAKTATEKALQESEEARRQAQAVSVFMVEVFRRPDPAEDGRELKVVTLLDEAVKNLEEKFAGSPRIKGELLSALGETYLGLGLPPEAVQVNEKAWSVRRDALGPNHSD